MNNYAPYSLPANVLHMVSYDKQNWAVLKATLNNVNVEKKIPHFDFHSNIIS